MFNLNFFIDAFQNTKKTLTNAIFVDETLNKAAHSYITAQTAFAKMLVQNTTDLTRYSVDRYSAILFPSKDRAS